MSSNLHMFSWIQKKNLLLNRPFREILKGSEKRQYKSINNKHMFLGSISVVLENRQIPEYFENEEGEIVEKKERCYLAESAFKGEWSKEEQIFLKFTTALAWLELIAVVESRKVN